MRIHAIQTGTVAINTSIERPGARCSRPINTLLDSTWTEPLPIYAWVIEHPEGLIVVDTGETARVAEPGYFPGGNPISNWACANWYILKRRSGRNCVPWALHQPTCAGCC